MKIPAPLIQLLQHLPETPPAFALVTALNLLRQPIWPEEDFTWLAGRTVRLQVRDLDCGVSLGWSNGCFITRPAQAAADVTFAASLADYWAIARQQEDPDTLFFQRRLSITGDTELGLQLKNLLDATDFSPLFHLGALRF
jgi:predicted lipid carrier protein YhbT